MTIKVYDISKERIVLFLNFLLSDLDIKDVKAQNLLPSVSRKEPQVFGSGDLKIIAIDCGMKNNIIRRLAQPGFQIKVVPWNYDFKKEDWDGLFISNGPGDPQLAVETINNIRWALAQGKVRIQKKKKNKKSCCFVTSLDLLANFWDLFGKSIACFGCWRTHLQIEVW